MQLDLWFAGSTLNIGNVLYIALLSVIGLFVWLTIDYRRQRAFYRQFEELSSGESDRRSDTRPHERSDERSLDEMSVLDQPVTKEQALYTEAWHALYGRLRADLVAERELNQRRIDLITQWVHHMKTPVAVIDLELQKACQAGSALLDSIREENERLRHALHMLLNMIRLDDFTQDFKIESVDIVAAVRDVINEQRRTFIAHNVFPKIEEPNISASSESDRDESDRDESDRHVSAPPESDRDETAPPPYPPRVRSDVKWLKFVLDQIVRNAIHYAARPDSSGPDDRGPNGTSPGGSGNVVFRWHKDSKGTVLEIADDGEGIKPEDLGRVFAPFFTGAGGREHRYATGMGLYLAKETCRKLGHDLTVESDPGEGTTVRIHFPDDSSLYADLGDVATAEVEM